MLKKTYEKLFKDYEELEKKKKLFLSESKKQQEKEKELESGAREEAERQRQIQAIELRKRENFYNITMFLSFFEELTSVAFYREIFKNNLQDKGVLRDSKSNAMLHAIKELKKPRPDKKFFVRKAIVLNDLSMIEKFSESAFFVIVSPCSYIGKRKNLNFAKYCHSLVIDLDFINIERIKFLFRVIFANEKRFAPLPSLIAASGNGLHLYYNFKTPIYLNKHNTEVLNNLKACLVRLFWNPKIVGDVPLQENTIFQSFRMVGSKVKFCDDLFVRGFKTGAQDFEVEDFNEYVELMKWAGLAGIGEFAIKERIPFGQLPQETQERLKRRDLAKHKRERTQADPRAKPKKTAYHW